ncbi:hypothetical protein [Streptosporangium longisporum]|uniref:Uncharacterized protein n=1 Tax=Streptosporangium longisporum TaxID=46187 RepID=A0ABP6L4K1_9ACTN
MCDQRKTKLLIGSEQEGGERYVRIWFVCPHAAEALSSRLGPPAVESVAEPTAVATIERAMKQAMGTMPGIVMARGDQRD